MWYGDIWNTIDINLSNLISFSVVSNFYTYTSTQLRLKERKDAEYLKTNFSELLNNWFTE